MNLKISTIIFSLVISIDVMAAVVCCCDDPKDVLESEKSSITELTNYFTDISAKTTNRIADYKVTKKNNNAMLLFGSKALVSTMKLKESVSMKENFEGLQASTAMDAAHIVDALVASELRRDAATEAENYSALINQ